MTRSGRGGEQALGLAAGAGLEHVEALRGEAGAQQPADRRLVVDDEDADGGGAHAACSARGPAAGRVTVKTAPGPVGAVAGDDGAAHRLDEAAADRKAEAGAGAHAVALLHAVELVEDALELVRRDALALVDDAQSDAARAGAAGLDPDGRALGGVFRGVVEQVEQHLLEEHRVDVDHRQVVREVDA